MISDTVYNDIIELIAKDVVDLNLSCIGSEMLLLALVNLQDSMTSLIFKELGVDSQTIKNKIKESCFLRKQGPYTTKFIDIIKKTMTLKEAKEYVYDEGYLYSLLTINDTVALDIINSLGISEREILRELDNACEYLERESHILVNITKLAKHQKLAQFIGRQNYLERLDRILSKKQKNNAMLIGAAGVGKTGLVEGLAMKYAIENPKQIIYRLDLGVIIAGTRYRGDLEERLLDAIEEIKTNNAIVFIDEIHNILSSSSNEASLDIANILKPVLSRSEIKCIGATTTEEYYKYIYKDKALARRFQNIFVEEVSDDECLEILQGIKNDYEEYHQVSYPEEILSFIIKISKMIAKKNPDKAIDLLDEAGLITKRNNEKIVSETTIINLVFEAIGINREKAIIALENTNEFPEIKQDLQAYLHLKNNKIITVINTNDKNRVLNWLNDIFAIKNDAILEIDLHDFLDNAFVTNLIGAPSGYVGYENGGVLTEHLIANPFSIIILKHLDSANIIVKGILTRAMETGTITDNKRRTIHLNNTIFMIENSNKVKEIGFIQKK